MLPVEKLRALYWAEIHMREARDTSNHLIALGEAGQELSHCLYTGIVVSYARSFGANKRLSGISSKFRKFTCARFQQLHDLLLDARDIIYAHKDIKKEGDKLSVGLLRDDLYKIKIHIADSGESHWIVQRASLPTNYLKDIIALCEFQIVRMNEESAAMLQHFCKGKDYHPGDYCLGENFP